ncbi:MAG TPA: hypothetical protein VLL48_03535, partial [Longimicrobiales bacterium]|nr:hypothetical protein [Longimicrobiales bacterium]
MKPRTRAPVVRALVAGGAALALAAPSGPLAAQNAWEVGVGGTVDGYAFDAPAEIGGLEYMVLATVPFGVAVQANERLRFEARGAYARGTLTTETGGDATLQGPTDTEIRASYVIVPGGLSAEVVGYLPTGKSSLTALEAGIASVVALDLLPMEISQWGTGGGIAAAVTGTRSFGTVGVGLTASYRVAGEYEPVEEDTDFTYKPGDEMRLR